MVSVHVQCIKNMNVNRDGREDAPTLTLTVTMNSIHCRIVATPELTIVAILE